jgi:nitrate reductase beta subunit
MPKVNNWQIGRDMEYPYEAPAPERQVAYIFDTNKCIACQTCTVACKTSWTSGRGQEHIFYNNVESRPYGGYPMGWDLKLLEKREPASWTGEKLASKTIFEDHKPTDPPTGHLPDSADYACPNLGEDDVAGMADKGQFFNGIHPMWMFYLARICNHCTYPACVAACPRKAVYKRPEDGIVLVDESRCRGYQECVKACPYKKVFYNIIGRASEKCIGCYPRVEQGDVALCVESCIGKIRLHGFLTTKGEPRPDNPLDYLIRIRKLALPLFPQHGTSPNVYYIPPVHVPDAYLEQLFGPGVEESKRLYRNLIEDREMLGAMMIFGSTNRLITRFKVTENEAIGWDVDDKEVTRVPFNEPHFIREHHDDHHDAYRTNTP